MAKKAGGLLGTLVICGAAIGIAKYLKDYAGAVYTDPDELKSMRESASRTKDAARRTFVALRNKEGVREAADELARSATDTLRDSGSVAATAGSGAWAAAKEVKERYDADPEAAKEELKDNLSQMKQDLVDKSQEVYDSIKNKFSQGEQSGSVDEAPDDGIVISDEE